MVNKIFLQTDTHLGHERMIEFGRVRDFENRIFKGLKVLTPEDIFIHLGDICIGNDEGYHLNYVLKIPCKKILVRGNHDKKTISWYLQYWDFVCDSFSLEVYGKKILFSHVPFPPQKELYDFNIHGHCHIKELLRKDKIYPYYDEKYHKLLSLEKLDYQLIQLKTFLGL